MNRESFGEYIKKIRVEKKMSIRKLASISGVSAGYISNFERSIRSTPHPDVIKKLAEALRVPYEEMMKEAGYTRQEDEAVNALAKTLQEVIKDSKTIDIKKIEQYKFEFNGQPLEPELARMAIQYILFLAKQNQKPTE